jgi:hypothetical protein
MLQGVDSKDKPLEDLITDVRETPSKGFLDPSPNVFRDPTSVPLALDPSLAPEQLGARQRVESPALLSTLSRLASTEGGKRRTEEIVLAVVP